MHKKILLTGASGFIGKHVYHELIKKQCSVYAISRNETNSNFIQIDILDEVQVCKLITRIKPDILIHLAWYVEHVDYWNSPLNEAYRKASINLFRSFLENGGDKIIATGTSAEYFESSSPVNEFSNVDLEQLTRYGKEKRLTYQWLQESESNYTWARLFGIYGPGEDQRRLLPYLINSIKTGREVALKKPCFYTDYVYVKDFAKFLSDSAFNLPMQDINIGSGTSISNNSLFEEVQSRLNKKAGNVIECKNPDVTSRIPCCNKLQSFGIHFDYRSGFKEYLI